LLAAVVTVGFYDGVRYDMFMILPAKVGNCILGRNDCHQGE